MSTFASQLYERLPQCTKIILVIAKPKLEGIEMHQSLSLQTRLYIRGLRIFTVGVLSYTVIACSSDDNGPDVVPSVESPVQVHETSLGDVMSTRIPMA